ncbi:MAG: hypothetical protein AB7L17_15135 [Ilumatobacteraceae bacterium]
MPPADSCADHPVVWPVVWSERARRCAHLALVAFAAFAAVVAISMLLEGRASASDVELPLPPADDIASGAQDMTGGLTDVTTDVVETLVPPPVDQPVPAPMEVFGPVVEPVLDSLPPDVGSAPGRPDGNPGDIVDDAVTDVVDGVAAVVAPTAAPLPDIAEPVVDGLLDGVRDATGRSIADPVVRVRHSAPAGRFTVPSPGAAPVTKPTAPLATVSDGIASDDLASGGATGVGELAPIAVIGVEGDALGDDARTTGPAGHGTPAHAPTPLAPTPPTPASGGDVPRTATSHILLAASSAAPLSGGTAWWLVAAGVFGWRSALVRSRLERPG